MSTHVYWRPNHKEEESLGDCFSWRESFRERFGGYPQIVNDGDRAHEWLGIAASLGHEGAAELCAAISKHGSVIVDARS